MSHPTLIDTAIDHPQISGVISLGAFMFSLLIKFADKLYSLHWPPIFIETLQIVGLVVAIPAGLITLYSFFSKKFGKKKTEK